eukprot:TRINITY_DN5783_c0_g1_i4.p1 TRINITY_DN5783_c0_g1~~TRINITY_DN5783_c0_g1_i4.p1  ORF type:complete len:385 (-),score=96.33 TRINITY_DN5783_c0_g1_i4:673-1827(-)
MGLMESKTKYTNLKDSPQELSPIPTKNIRAQVGNEADSPTSPQSPGFDEEHHNRVAFLLEKLEKFEGEHGNISAFYYVLAASVILSVIIVLLRFTSEPVPPLQVIFLAFLITFLLNYFVLRESDILPYLESEEDSFQSKLCGGSFLFAIICFYYAQTMVSAEATLTIWFTAPLMTLAAERFVLKIVYSEKEHIAFGLGFLGALVICKPPLFWGSKTDGSLWGLIFAFLAAGFLTAGGLLVRKLHQHSSFTLNHIIGMFIILFLPLFFPMQGVVKLNIFDWVLILIIGVLAFVAILLFVRSFQLERSVRVLSASYLQLVFLVIVSILFGGSFGGVWSLFGAVAILASVFGIMVNTNLRIQVASNISGRHTASEFDMRVLPKHSIS